AMLQKAKKRVAELRLKNVEGLAVMDAEKLEFPDNSFDVVMAQYVVTAVPNPEAALDEFARVLRPGGELIILTRVSADDGVRRFIEQRLQPVVRPLGFRTAEFAWSRYAKWLAGARGIELVERRLVPPLGHFSLVRFRKIDVAVAAGGGSLIAFRIGLIVICHHDDVTCLTPNPSKRNPDTLGGDNDREFPAGI